MSNNNASPDLPIPISSKAISKLKEYSELLIYDNKAFIRLGVKKEGAHMKKVIGVDEKRFTDQAYEMEDISFVIDRRELKHLEGSRLDFKETNAQKGFIYRPVK